MNKFIVALMASFAVSAFAAEPAKALATPAPAASAPAKAEVKKEAEVKKAAQPVKSTPAKDEKAAVPATKPASK